MREPFFNCQYVQISSFTTTLKTYHVSDDITPQIKLLTTVNYLLISRQSFKPLKEFERDYIFLIDQTPNWDTSHKRTNNINLKQTYCGIFQSLSYDVMTGSDMQMYHHVLELINH